MNSVLAQLAPQAHRDLDHQDGDVPTDAAAWGSMAGFGNLNKAGGVDGMQVPRVPDVSPLTYARSTLMSYSPLHSSTFTLHPCLPTRTPRSSSHTVQRRWHSGSKGVSLLLLIRVRRLEATLVSFCLKGICQESDV